MCRYATFVNIGMPYGGRLPDLLRAGAISWHTTALQHTLRIAPHCIRAQNPDRPGRWGSGRLGNATKASVSTFYASRRSDLLRSCEYPLERGPPGPTMNPCSSFSSNRILHHEPGAIAAARLRPRAPGSLRPIRPSVQALNAHKSRRFRLIDQLLLANYTTAAWSVKLESGQ